MAKTDISTSKWYPWLLLAPALLTIFAIVIFPLIFSLSRSFTNFNLIIPVWQYIGFQNYSNAFSDPKVWASAKFTLIFALSSTSIQLVLGLLSAVCLQNLVTGRRLATSLLMLPMMVTPVVVGIIWLMMFQPDYSVINGMLRWIGVEGPIWLQSPGTARFAVIVADVWQWTPFFTVILLAGLLNFPQDLKEAGYIDGATPLQVFRLLTLPIIMPLILVTFLIRLIDSFKTFDSIFVMTNGGPSGSTETLSMYIYRQGLPYLEAGYSMAVSYLFVIFLVVLTTILIRILRRL